MMIIIGIFREHLKTNGIFDQIWRLSYQRGLANRREIKARNSVTLTEFVLQNSVNVTEFRAFISLQLADVAGRVLA